MARGTRRECRNGVIGKTAAQTAQLAILGTELVSPLRYAVGFVDREKCNGNMLQPCQRVGTLKPFWRQIQQTVGAFASLAHDSGLLFIADRTVKHRGRNPRSEEHTSELQS